MLEEHTAKEMWAEMRDFFAEVIIKMCPGGQVGRKTVTSDAGRGCFSK